MTKKQSLQWHPPAWAWRLEGADGVCRWAEPDRDRLVSRSRPSSEAKPERVRIVPLKEYQILLRLAGEGQ